MLKGLVIVPSYEILNHKREKKETIEQEEKEEISTVERESWMTTPREEEKIEKEIQQEETSIGPSLDVFKPKEVEVKPGISKIDVSWRLKSLERARERAKEEGTSVDEILLKTWGKTEAQMVELIEEQKNPNRKKNSSSNSYSFTQTMRKPEESMDLKWKQENISEKQKTEEKLENVKTPQQQNQQTSTTINMSEDLNKLSAKALKAQLMGDMDTYNELNKKIEQIRSLVKKGFDEVVVLPEFDAKGNKITKKLGDSANLDDLVLEMRQNSNSHENVMYKSYGEMDTDEQYDTIGTETSQNKKRKRNQEDSKLRKKQINEYNKMKQIGETCTLCYNSPKMKKYLIIALGEKTFLAIPPFGSLLKGHCIISTFEHRLALNQCDEDEWNEIQKFRTSLKKMFVSMGKDVVFIETVTSYNMKKQLHSFMECIPLSQEDFEVAPGYFKKAIMDSDSEWSQNKKLIDTRGRGITKSVPKDFPYFHVEFTLSGGFAHVIEDWTKFPYFFGREIIAGMLDLPLNLIKEREEDEEIEKKNVLEFVKNYEKFDWTIELDGGEY
eukprot:gene7335-11654_t